MAPRRASKLFDHIELTVDPVAELRQDVNADDETSASKLADTLSDKLFKKDVLDRKLERHHITGNRHRFAFEMTWRSDNGTGIAFSGAVGIGIYQTSSEIIALGGPVGAFIAYIFAGLLYGNMEWVFKWLKILLLVALCILMIAIRAGAMFQFMGGEMVLVTAGEAKKPRRDLPTAARYMYLLPVGFYLVAILLVGVNVDYLDPRFYHSHVSWYSDPRLNGIQTAQRSPFVIAIENARIKTLPGFLDACFLFSSLTAA
ncbi:MAG: hypothetical protein Q9195_001199 [Heterodermia aff. obscurata]